MSAMSDVRTVPSRPINSPAQVLFASLIGSTIEFFDFYIYATAAVLVFPRLFFPKSNPASGMLGSLATFAIAFIARPIGSVLFGHFGDRVSRKTTLVAALLTSIPWSRWGRQQSASSFRSQTKVEMSFHISYKSRKH